MGLIWTLLFCLILFGLVFFAYGIRGEETFPKTVSFVAGVAFLLIALIFVSPVIFPTGQPLTAIDGGEYKVAFVYVAGDNVSVGIEKDADWSLDEGEKLFLYQFPKSAFDSSLINTQAKKLVVVESGKFRRLMLE